MAIVAPQQSPEERFVKINLREALLSFVYRPWEDHLAKWMDELILANAARLVKANDPHCLRLRGVCYWHSSTQQSPNDYYPSTKLHPSLEDEAANWVGENTEIMDEKRLVSHSLSAILSATSRAEDYFQLLPESLHNQVHNQMQNLPDPAQHPRASAEVITHLQKLHAPYIARMGQRYVMSLII